jgi:hypothetical protein
VKSSSDTIITDAEFPVIEWNDDDDPPFTIEYEVRSTTSGDYDNSDASSDEESHHRQVSRDMIVLEKVWSTPPFTAKMYRTSPVVKLNSILKINCNPTGSITK